MRLAQGDTAGVEATADEGYVLTKYADDNTDIYARLAEYEALQVYVPIKMAFGKLNEAGRLLQRAADIGMGERWEVDVFKHIKFYKNYARYHEVRGNAAEACATPNAQAFCRTASTTAMISANSSASNSASKWKPSANSNL